MHFIVSWDIPDASWDVVNRRMLDCFKGYEQERPVSTVYLVKVGSLMEYQIIFGEMQQVAKETGLRFISCALFSFAGWDGWLATSEDWNKIKQIAG